MSNTKDIVVIVTGTDPQTASGGIGFAMPGYLAALRSAGYETRMISTYRPDSFTGKWWPWAKGVIRLCFEVVRNRKQGSKVVVYSHPGAGIALVREGILLALGRILQARTMVQLHAGEIDFYLNKAIGRIGLKFALVGACKICVLTPWWKQRLEPVLQKEVETIPNPMPDKLKQEAREPKATNLNFVSTSDDSYSCRILTMSKLRDGKGIDKVIKSLPKMNAQVNLVVAGDGPQRDELYTLVHELGVDHHVTFSGFVRDRQKHDLLKNSHIFCLPSKLDSFGMIYLEAMAYGLPVVALNYQSTPYVVPHNKAGILVDTSEPSELAGALDHLATDQDLRQRLGKEGKEWVLKQFSIEAVGMKLDEVTTGMKASRA